MFTKKSRLGVQLCCIVMIFYQEFHSNYPFSYNYIYCKLLHGHSKKSNTKYTLNKYGTLEFSVLSCSCIFDLSAPLLSTRREMRCLFPLLNLVMISNRLSCDVLQSLSSNVNGYISLYFTSKVQILCSIVTHFHRASDLLTVKRMRRIATRDNTIQLGIRLSSRFQKSKVFTKLFILVRNFALINE